MKKPLLLFFIGLTLFGWVAQWWLPYEKTFLPPLLIFYKMGAGVKYAHAFITHTFSSFEEVHRLSHENDQLKVDILQMESLTKENLRLKKLLSLPPSFPPHTLVAQIIGRNPEEWFSEIWINRGKQDGVYKGAVVVAPEGLVGWVEEVFLTSSKVQLISHPEHRVGCIVGRTRAPGILVGQTENKALLTYMFPPVSLKVGDHLVTSGMGQIYPKGIPVGKIERVIEQKENVVPLAYVAFYALLDRLEEVFVRLSPTTIVNSPKGTRTEK